ncbi:MAG: hypothetical protein QF460_03380, partial [Candidatus Nanoarchaeia archaeon]|nr:hypothetical protein [Candidatus Nanoarchaeia archaeon]
TELTSIDETLARIVFDYTPLTHSYLSKLNSFESEVKTFNEETNSYSHISMLHHFTEGFQSLCTEIMGSLKVVPTYAALIQQRNLAPETETKYLSAIEVTREQKQSLEALVRNKLLSDLQERAQFKRVSGEIVEEIAQISNDEGSSFQIDGDMDELVVSVTGDSSLSFHELYGDFVLSTWLKEFRVTFPQAESGIPLYYFYDNFFVEYNQLDFYQDSDSLETGDTLTYSNSGVNYYGSTLSTDGFNYLGHFEPNYIVLDSGVEELEFVANPIDTEDIYYAIAVQYETSSGKEKFSTFTNLDSSSSETISLYDATIPISGDDIAIAVVVMPYTLDNDPSDGDGNNFEFQISAS